MKVEFKIKFETILSWGRYLHWSDMHFHQYFGGSEEELFKEDHPTTMRTFAIISQWLASLYVVLEGWKELNDKDYRIDKILNISKKYPDLLRRYRNAVYHYQPKLFDRRFSEFTKEGIAPLLWASSLELEFQRYFWEWPKKYFKINEQIDEVRDSIKDMIGWIPVDIFASKKCMVEKTIKESKDLLAKDDNKESKHYKELKKAIEMSEHLIQDVKDIEIDDIVNKITNNDKV